MHAKFGGYVLAWEFSFPLLPSYQPFLYFCSMFGYELWLKIKEIWYAYHYIWGKQLPHSYFQTAKVEQH